MANARPVRNKSVQTHRGSRQGNDKDGLTLHLSKLCPLSFRLVLKRSIGWALIAALLLAIAGFTVYHSPSVVTDPASLNFIKQCSLGLGLVGLCLIVVRLGYEEVRRRCYYYGVEQGQFVIRKGVILKHRGSFPLSDRDRYP